LIREAREVLRRKPDFNFAFFADKKSKGSP